jgi:hypothetical protein
MDFPDQLPPWVTVIASLAVLWFRVPIDPLPEFSLIALEIWFKPMRI